MKSLRGAFVLRALPLVVAFVMSAPDARAEDPPDGSWPSKIPVYWEAIEDVPLKNVSGVKAIKLKLEIRRRVYIKPTGEVKSLWGGLTYQNVFDDTKAGWALWALDDHQTRYNVPELIVDGMEAKAVEHFTFWRKNTRITTLRPNKPIPDELVLTITDSNPRSASERIVPVKNIRFRALTVK